ncbi:hypothetical protein FQN51_003073 [Onygenales sp. PD_10]|nr:hypothetical protein FQN51_003073 [Onygenales sp. PD_10]
MASRRSSYDISPAPSSQRRTLTPRIKVTSAAAPNNEPATSPMSPLSPLPSHFSSSFLSPMPVRRRRSRSRSRSRGSSRDRTASPTPSVESGSDEAPDDTPIKRTTTTEQPASSGPPRFTSSFSFPSSSQRLVKNGQVVVTNSDEDTDASSSSDDEDLLAQFLRPRVAPAATAPPASSDDESVSDTKPGNKRKLDTTGPGRSVQRPSSSNSDLLDFPTAPTKFQFSIAALAKSAEEDRRADARVAEAKRLLEETRARVNDAKKTSALTREEIIASVVEGEGTQKAQRLRDAVDRIEAFDEVKSWRFFEDTAPSVSPVEFPELYTLPAVWEAYLKDATIRQRAFNSGIVGDTINNGMLPEEMLHWILISVPAEPCRELRGTYCAILRDSSRELISSLFCPSHIGRLFQTLGARKAAWDVSETLKPDFYFSDEYRNRDYQSLLSVLELLQGLALKFHDDTRLYALKLVFRLATDEAIMTDGLVCLEVQKTITALLGESANQISDQALHDLTTHIYATTRDLELQAHLLNQIPPTTPRIALLRCRLAWAFFYTDPSPLEKSAKSLFDLNHLTNHLRHDPRFDTRKRYNKEPPNYHELYALTAILAIAIDSGTATASFHDANNNNNNSKDDPKQREARAYAREREESFNASVDALADRIKWIFSQIQDSGASHLRRSEAKARLEMLHYRLVYGVRTRPRAAKQWFVREKGKMGVGGRVERGQATMDGFVRKGGEGEEG